MCYSKTGFHSGGLSQPVFPSHVFILFPVKFSAQRYKKFENQETGRFQKYKNKQKFFSFKYWF